MCMRLPVFFTKITSIYVFNITEDHLLLMLDKPHSYYKGPLE